MLHFLLSQPLSVCGGVYTGSKLTESMLAAFSGRGCVLTRVTRCRSGACGNAASFALYHRSHRALVQPIGVTEGISQPTSQEQEPTAPAAAPQHTTTQAHYQHSISSASLEHHAAARNESGPASTSGSSSDVPLEHMTAAEADAACLFDFTSSHVPAWSPGLVAYAPLGCVLAVTRMLLWVGGVLIDAEQFKRRDVSSCFLRLLGFQCIWHNVDRLPTGRHIMVTNHVTPADLLVLFEGLPQRYIHLITTAMPQRCTATRNLPLVLRCAGWGDKWAVGMCEHVGWGDA